MNGLILLSAVGGGQASPLRVEMLRCSLAIFAAQKASGISNPRWPQSVKKVEMQEALPPAGVIGAAPLTLVPQHFPRKPA